MNETVEHKRRFDKIQVENGESNLLTSVRALTREFQIHGDRDTVMRFHPSRLRCLRFGIVLLHKSVGVRRGRLLLRVE